MEQIAQLKEALNHQRVVIEDVKDQALALKARVSKVEGENPALVDLVDQLNAQNKALEALFPVVDAAPSVEPQVNEPEIVQGI